MGSQILVPGARRLSQNQVFLPLAKIDNSQTSSSKFCFGVSNITQPPTFWRSQKSNYSILWKVNTNIKQKKKKKKIGNTWICTNFVKKGLQGCELAATFSTKKVELQNQLVCHSKIQPIFLPWSPLPTLLVQSIGNSFKVFILCKQTKQQEPNTNIIYQYITEDIHYQTNLCSQVCVNYVYGARYAPTTLSHIYLINLAAEYRYLRFMTYFGFSLFFFYLQQSM